MADKGGDRCHGYGSGETVCGVARRHGLTPQQLFSWRRLARQTALSPATIFVPAVVGPAAPGAADPCEDAAAGAPPSQHVDGIELEIAGVEVRIGADAKPRSIEAVICALKATS